MVKSHYVSRFQTRPWETNDGQRRLWIADLALNKLEPRPSLTAFRVEDGLSDDEEQAFNRTFEYPVSLLRDQWVREGQVTLDTCETSRALLLMLIVHVHRYGVLRQGAPIRELDLLKEDPVERDRFLAFLCRDKQLRVLHVPDNKLLFVPETGVFPLPLRTPGQPKQWEIGWAMAIHPSVVVTLSHKSAAASLQDIIDRRLLTDFSLGIHPTDTKIVVPPPIAETVPRDETLAKMRDARAKLCALFEKVGSYRAKFDRMLRELTSI